MLQPDAKTLIINFEQEDGVQDSTSDCYLTAYSGQWHCPWFGRLSLICLRRQRGGFGTGLQINWVAQPARKVLSKVTHLIERGQHQISSLYQVIQRQYFIHIFFYAWRLLTISICNLSHNRLRQISYIRTNIKPFPLRSIPLWRHGPSPYLRCLSRIRTCWHSTAGYASKSGRPGRYWDGDFEEYKRIELELAGGVGGFSGFGERRVSEYSRRWLGRIEFVKLGVRYTHERNETKKKHTPILHVIAWLPGVNVLSALLDLPNPKRRSDQRSEAVISAMNAYSKVSITPVRPTHTHTHTPSNADKVRSANATLKMKTNAFNSFLIVPDSRSH